MRNLIERFKSEGTPTSKIVFGIAVLIFLVVIVFFIVEVARNGWDVGFPGSGSAAPSIDTAIAIIGGIL